MPTLYTHRAENIRRTWLLMGAFVVLVGILGRFFAAVFDSRAVFPFALTFAILSSFFSYWFSDKIVIMLARAKPLAKEDDPELYRIVENLAMTAGLPMPKLYVVRDPSPNAFATGRDAQHAVVAVTTGLRALLTKPELEGVIAHELSHIGNRDMLVATIAAVLAGVIVTLADLFARMTFWGGVRRDRREDGDATGVLLLIGVIGAVVLAPLAATLLRLAISRRREFLADASGALLTRYPEGLASALEKIAAANVPARHNAQAIAHLWLSDPNGRRRRPSWLSSLFLTHPPIEDRIRALQETAS